MALNINIVNIKIKHKGVAASFEYKENKDSFHVSGSQCKNYKL